MSTTIDGGAEHAGEKEAPKTSVPESIDEAFILTDTEERNEVFQKTSDGVDFRTVGWPMASIIFLKRTLAPP